jgi:hypothetical protein
MKKIVLMIGIFFFINLQAAMNLNFIYYRNETRYDPNDWHTDKPLWRITEKDLAQAEASCQSEHSEAEAAIVKGIANKSIPRSLFTNWDPVSKKAIEYDTPKKTMMKKWLKSCIDRRSVCIMNARLAVNFAEMALNKIHPETALKSLFEKTVTMRQGLVDASAEINGLILSVVEPKAPKYIYSDCANMCPAKEYDYWDRMIFKNKMLKDKNPNAYRKVLDFVRQVINTKVLKKVELVGKSFGIAGIGQQLMTKLNPLIDKRKAVVNGKPVYESDKCHENRFIKMYNEHNVCEGSLGEITGAAHEFFNTIIDKANESFPEYQVLLDQRKALAVKPVQVKKPAFDYVKPKSLSFLDYIIATASFGSSQGSPQWAWSPADIQEGQKTCNSDAIQKQIKTRVPMIPSFVRITDSLGQVIEYFSKGSVMPKMVKKETILCTESEPDYLTNVRNAAYFADEVLHKIVSVSGAGAIGVALKGLSEKANIMRQGFVDASLEVNKLLLLYLIPDAFLYRYDPMLSDYRLTQDYKDNAEQVVPYRVIFGIIKQTINKKVLNLAMQAGKTFGINIGQQLVDLLNNQVQILTEDTIQGKLRFELLGCDSSYKNHKREWQLGMLERDKVEDKCTKIIGELGSITNQLFNTVIDQVNKVMQSMQK